jgi:hypothetical protein
LLEFVFLGGDIFRRGFDERFQAGRLSVVGQREIDVE